MTNTLTYEIFYHKNVRLIYRCQRVLIMISVLPINICLLYYIILFV